MYQKTIAPAAPDGLGVPPPDTFAQPHEEEEPAYDVRSDPAWAHHAVAHVADNAEFLNGLKPEQRAKVLQMLQQHSGHTIGRVAKTLLRR